MNNIIEVEENELKDTVKGILKIMYSDLKQDPYKLDDLFCKLTDILNMPSPVGLPGRRQAEHMVDYAANLSRFLSHN